VCAARSLSSFSFPTCLERILYSPLREYPPEQELSWIAQLTNITRPQESFVEKLMRQFIFTLEVSLHIRCGSRTSTALHTFNALHSLLFEEVVDLFFDFGVIELFSMCL